MFQHLLDQSTFRLRLKITMRIQTASILMITLSIQIVTTSRNVRYFDKLRSDQGQKYMDGDLLEPFNLKDAPNVNGTLVNKRDYIEQVKRISYAFSDAYSRNRGTFDDVLRWLVRSGDPQKLRRFHVEAHQMQGNDYHGNIKLTAFYTPRLSATKRILRYGRFVNPLFRMPTEEKFGDYPSIDEMVGEMKKESPLIGFSNHHSSVQVMIMQGNALIEFRDRNDTQFYAYMDDIQRTPWYSQISAALQRFIFANFTNREVFLKTMHKKGQPIILLKPFPPPPEGTGMIPLIPFTAVQTDTNLIPAGATLLVEIPKLNWETGDLTGEYELRLMVALGVGRQLKGNHLEIYFGNGTLPAQKAALYNCFGRVWRLKSFSRRIFREALAGS